MKIEPKSKEGVKLYVLFHTRDFSVENFTQVFIGQRESDRPLNGQIPSGVFDSTPFEIFNTFCDSLYLGNRF